MAHDHDFAVKDDGTPFVASDYTDRHAEIIGNRYDDGLGDFKRRAVFALAGSLGGTTVADVACGVGNFADEARRLGAATAIAIDFAESMTTATHRRHPDLPVLRASGTALPLVDGCATSRWHSTSSSTSTSRS